MKSHHAMTTCPGCGCVEGETPNDECWLCQTDGEARVGDCVSSYGFERPELAASASAASACD